MKKLQLLLINLVLVTSVSAQSKMQNIKVDLQNSKLVTLAGDTVEVKTDAVLRGFKYVTNNSELDSAIVRLEVTAEKRIYNLPNGEYTSKIAKLMLSPADVMSMYVGFDSAMVGVLSSVDDNKWK